MDKMKNFFLILILLAVVQTTKEVAGKADEISGNMFAFEKSVDEMYNKVQGIVAEGYSEPDEEVKDKPKKKGILRRLLNLFKR
jgi:hypothetical protein